MKFILGKKIGMTQVWQEDRVISVTRIQAGPCKITQIKKDDKDGYAAVQIAYGNRKEKNIAKPQKGHLKDLGSYRYLREFRMENVELKRGQIIDVSTFENNDKITVTGISKGKGFQGVVKRYGFKGTKKTHGNKDQLRMPGSIGAKGPAHVFKGTRMGGRTGGDKVTISNLKVVAVDLEKNELLIKGAVPGARNGLIMVWGSGELKVKESTVEKKEEPDKKVEVNIEAAEVEKKEEVKTEPIVEVVEEANERKATEKDKKESLK